MLYNVVLVSAMQQLEPAISTVSISSLLSLPPPPPSAPLGHHGAPSRAPCAVQQPPTSSLAALRMVVYICQCCSLFRRLHFFFFPKFYLFIAVLSLRCCTRSFFSCSEPGLLSRCGVQVSHRSGSSCCRARALECGLSSCAAQA